MNDNAYVTADGNYGADRVIMFKRDQLTEEQWWNLSDLSDYDRLPYVMAILNGEDLSEWEDN